MSATARVASHNATPGDASHDEAMLRAIAALDTPAATTAGNTDDDQRSAAQPLSEAEQAALAAVIAGAATPEQRDMVAALDAEGRDDEATEAE